MLLNRLDAMNLLYVINFNVLDKKSFDFNYDPPFRNKIKGVLLNSRVFEIWNPNN